MQYSTVTVTPAVLGGTIRADAALVTDKVRIVCDIDGGAFWDGSDDYDAGTFWQRGSADVGRHEEVE